MGNEVKMHHATLKLHGIAVLYLPYAEHPVDFGRKSGFLIPEVGDSSIKGFILGDAFFWALSRNTDVTLGATLYAARGWAQLGDSAPLGTTTVCKPPITGSSMRKVRQLLIRTKVVRTSG